MFPECLGTRGRSGGSRARGDFLLLSDADLRFLLRDPRARFVGFGRSHGWGNNNTLTRRQLGRLLHNDLLYLFFPGAEFGSAEWPHRCRRLDWRQRSRRNLRSRLYFWRWRGSRGLPEGFQEFPDPIGVGFRLSSLHRLGVFRPPAGSARRLRRPLLLPFLRFLGDACNQARNTNDRRNNNEDDVLIEVHGKRGGNP